MEITIKSPHHRFLCTKAPLLLVGRLGNPHLFAASLHHAAFVAKLKNRGTRKMGAALKNRGLREAKHRRTSGFKPEE